MEESKCELLLSHALRLVLLKDSFKLFSTTPPHPSITYSPRYDISLRRHYFLLIIIIQLGAFFLRVTCVEN